jgi:hypothetical protein
MMRVVNIEEADKATCAHLPMQKKDAPSILPWQDRGRVKIGIGSNSCGLEG